MSSKSKEIAKLRRKYSKNPAKKIDFKNVKTFVLSQLPSLIAVPVLKCVLDKSDYLLKRESIKFFHLSSVAYGAKHNRRCLRLLGVALKLLGSNIPNSYVELIKSAVISTLKNSKNRCITSDEILDATRELDPILIDATCWYQLSRGLFCFGFSRAAWVARENSLDQSIVEGSRTESNPLELKRALEAHLERRNFGSINELFLSQKEKTGKYSFIDLQRHLSLFNNSAVRFEDNQFVNNYECAELFSSMVLDKIVSLVGSGSPSGELGDDVDSSDSVIRLKFVGQEYLPKQEILGSRCDVSQYNSIEVLCNLAEDNNIHLFTDSLKMIISNSDFRKLRDTPVFPLLDFPVYRSTAVSGLRCLATISMFRPAKLKVFCFDFYTKIEQYDQNLLNFYYEDGWKLGNWFGVGDRKFTKAMISKEFSTHDLVSNFCFAQNLYKAGLFDIEPYGKSILELTPFQYVERLEEMLGDW